MYLRRCSNATVYAIDLPTGIGEEGVDADAVVADFTLTVGFPKTALFRDDATNYVGRILVVELAELSSRGPKDPGRAILSGPENLKNLVPRRSFDSHKGDYGRVGVMAGSRGFVGASILCSEAAARAGAGLISLVCSRGDLQPGRDQGDAGNHGETNVGFSVGAG